MSRLNIGRLPPLNLRRNWPKAVAITVLLAVGVNHVVEAVADWHLHDLHVYADAAERLLAGDELYGGDVNPLNAYRYAPWFAYAFIPLALLPDPVLWVGWSILLLAGSIAALWGLGYSFEGRVLLLAFAPILFAISAGGNVQALMVAGLAWGLSTKWGWLAVGLAASLKIVPIAFVAVFIAQRRWRQAIASAAVAGLLWLPILAFRVDPVTWDAGLARTLPTPVWLVQAALAAGATLWLAWRRSPLTTLAAGTAAVLALPRLFIYEATMLIPATRGHDDASAGT